MGWSIDEICAEYELTLAEVHAALAYYFDHQEEIDRRIDADEAFVAEQRRRTLSVLEKNGKHRAVTRIRYRVEKPGGRRCE
jgi:hypothetical protein